MDLFEIDFDEKRHELSIRYSDDPLYNDDNFADMMAQADAVIKNEKENTQRRAEACVKKFQLLEIRRKLAPKLLEKALELYPDMPQALTSMGRFYLHTQNMEKAIEYFNKVVDIDPSYPYVWLEKASIESDIEESIRFYSEFLKLKPDSIIGYEKRSRLYEEIVLEEESLINQVKLRDRLSAIQNAINNFSELIRLDPSNWLNYEGRAKMRLRMSKTIALLKGECNNISSCNDGFIKDIEQLMLLYPTDCVIDCITTIHNIFRDLPKGTANEYITKIISDLPADSTAHFIALILLADEYSYDESEKAIEIFSKIINSLEDGDLLQLHCFYHRAFWYSARKEFEKALADNAMIIKYGSLLPKMKRQYTSEPYFAREHRADIYEEMNDLTGAINEYTLLLDWLNNTGERIHITDAYFKRAGLFMKNGETDRALADYSAIIDLGIGGVEHSLKKAYAASIKIYKTRGEMDKAFATYIKMSELEKEEDDLFMRDCIETEFEIEE
jgi:tetratricopeptide (TPR) repeat protein